MRVAAWNIRQGGGKQADAVAEAVGRLDADVIGLQEVSDAKADAWCERLAALRYATIVRSADGAGLQGMLLGSRVPIVTTTQSTFPFPARWIEVRVRDSGLRIGLVHLPQEGPGQKRNSWAWVAEWARRHRDERAIVLGDTNTVWKGGADGTELSGANWLDQVARHGWVDAYRHLHPHGQARSFATKHTSWRCDLALVSPKLMADVVALTYEPHNGLSDHTPLVVAVSGSRQVSTR